MIGIGLTIFLFLFATLSIINLGTYVLMPKNAWQALLLNYSINLFWIMSSGINPVIYYHTMTLVSFYDWKII